MTWVRDIARAHPDEFVATMRADFGVRLHELESDADFAELVAFTRVAVSDPSTRLGAAHQGWAYRASIPELVQVATGLGEKAEEHLPWGMAAAMRRAEARKVTDSDMQAARERLARVSAMRRLDGFEGSDGG